MTAGETPETREIRERRRSDGSLLGRWRFLACPDDVPGYEVRCLEDGAGFGPPEPETIGRILLGRSGGYLRRVDGRESFADRTSALLLRPGAELSFAHPMGTGDAYTVVEVPPCAIARWTTDERWLTGPTWDGIADDELDLRHRELLAACRRGADPFEATERTLVLVAAVVDAASGRRDAEGVDRAVRRRPATLAAHRRLAYRACEAIVDEGFTLGLIDLARRVACSPHHLSRVFHRVTGESLTAYRHRLRVRAVLDAIEEDGADLRTIAATHGFADQAHLTRVVRQRLGRSPSAVRRMLAPGRREVSTDVQRRPGGPHRA